MFFPSSDKEKHAGPVFLMVRLSLAYLLLQEVVNVKCLYFIQTEMDAWLVRPGTGPESEANDQQTTNSRIDINL